MHNPSDIRLKAIYDIGVKVDDSLEVARLETAKREGAYEAYSNISSSFSEIFEQLDSEHAGGEAELARAWMSKFIDVCKNMVEYSSMQVYAARGAENQTKMIVEMIKKTYDLETEKKVKRSELETPHIAQEVNQKLVQGPEAVDVTSAQSAVHVRSRTIKEQRQRSQVAAK